MILVSVYLCREDVCVCVHVCVCMSLDLLGSNKTEHHDWKYQQKDFPEGV
jgi:hypothetical protein